MPFKESNIGRKIGKKEVEKDKKDLELLESIQKEIKEKYPGYVKWVEKEEEKFQYNTERWKEEEPELLPTLKELNKYVQRAGFKKVLLVRGKEKPISVEPLSNSIYIEKRCLLTIKILKNFAPDFLDKALTHIFGQIKKDIFGRIKEKIPGHEREHFKGQAIQWYPKMIEASIKLDKAILKAISEEEMSREEIEEGKKINKEFNKLEEMVEFYVELQRISKLPTKEVIDGIASVTVLSTLLHLGIDPVPQLEIDKEETKRLFSESPSKEEKAVKGTYPYLKERVIDDVIERMEEIIKDLKRKYEKWEVKKKKKKKEEKEEKEEKKIEKELIKELEEEYKKWMERKRK